MNFRYSHLRYILYSITVLCLFAALCTAPALADDEFVAVASLNELNTYLTDGVLQQNIRITNTITIDEGDLKISGGDGTTIMRDCTACLFTVSGSGKLILGGSGTTLIIDGNNTHYPDLQTSLILVKGNSANLTMQDGVTLKNNSVVGKKDVGGAVTVNSGEFLMAGGTITNNSVTTVSDYCYGGGVYVSSSSAKMNMTGGMISGNKVINGGKEGSGGGISVQNGAILNITGGIITENYADWGGGIYLGKSTMTMNNGNIFSNSGKYGGGITIFRNCNAEITESSITGNTAQEGGGIFIKEDTPNVVIKDSSITGNTATTSGGGIDQRSGTLTIENSQITSNTATTLVGSGNGGGISQMQSGTLRLQNTNVSENTAYNEGGGIFMAGTTTIIGGNITENIAWNNGGGISFYDRNRQLTISGNNLIIQDNYVGEHTRTKNNIPLGSIPLIVSDEAHLGAGSDIGISTTLPVGSAVVNGAAATDVYYIHPDDPKYYLAYDETAKTLTLQEPAYTLEIPITPISLSETGGTSASVSVSITSLQQTHMLTVSAQSENGWNLIQEYGNDQIPISYKMAYNGGGVTDSVSGVRTSTEKSTPTPILKAIKTKSEGEEETFISSLTFTIQSPIVYSGEYKDQIVFTVSISPKPDEQNPNSGA